MNVDKLPLTTSHVLACPSCGKSVYIAHPFDIEIPGGGTWLRDGDTIGGLKDMLSEAQKTPDAFDCELMVGGCRACGEDYYVALASFMEGGAKRLKLTCFLMLSLGMFVTIFAICQLNNGC